MIFTLSSLLYFPIISILLIIFFNYLYIFSFLNILFFNIKFSLLISHIPISILINAFYSIFTLSSLFHIFDYISSFFFILVSFFKLQYLQMQSPLPFYNHPPSAYHCKYFLLYPSHSISYLFSLFS